MITVIPKDSEALNVWPNPNSGEGMNIVIQGFDDPTTTVTITIADLTGKLVRSQDLLIEGETLNTTVSTDQLNAGAYLVTVHTPYRDWTRRLIVN
jgi:hypothetical protein